MNPESAKIDNDQEIAGACEKRKRLLEAPWVVNQGPA